MEDQKLQSSPQIQTGIPKEWLPKYLIKRIDEEDIVITEEQRNGILASLNQGQRFVQVGKYTLMLNAIKSIDPYYEPDNIPPRPKEQYLSTGIVDNLMTEKLVNGPEIVLWDKLFGQKRLK